MADSDPKNDRTGVASVDVVPVANLVTSVGQSVPAGSGGALTVLPQVSQSQLDLLRIAVDEYRFAVNLGWDRGKYFIGLNVTVLGGVAAISKVQGLEGNRLLLVLVLILSGLLAIVGGFIVWKSHDYYRNARNVLRAMQGKLPTERWEFALVTTDGFRVGGKKSSLPKITTLLLSALVGLFVFDGIAGFYVGCAGGEPSKAASQISEARPSIAGIVDDAGPVLELQSEDVNRSPSEDAGFSSESYTPAN